MNKYGYIKEFINKTSCMLITSQEDFLFEKERQKKSDFLVNIHVRCKCGDTFKVNFSRFKNKNKRQCNICGGVNRRRSQSFTTEDFKRKVFEKKGDLYEVIGEYYNNKTHIKMKCLVCEHVWDVRPDCFLSRNGCPVCGRQRQIASLMIEENDFLKRVDSLPNKYTVLSRYKGMKKNIKVRHDECGYVWSPQAYDLLNGDSICPNCYGKNKRKSTYEFKKDVYSLVGDEYIVLGEYINNRTKIKVRHSICNSEYNVEPNMFLCGRRCPACKESKGEAKIRIYLENNKISYEQEYVFKDCRNKRPLPFDFYLPDINMLIEYDGEQHFKPIKFTEQCDNSVNNALKSQKIRDEIKTQYCKDNNIRLLRIPYWEFDNIEAILSEQIDV